MAAELRDSDLVARARAGDRLAVSSLLERHRPLARRLAARLLGDPVEAEDVAQEASLQAWLSLDRLRRPERFGAWLAGIALNLARMRLRARRTVPLPEDEAGGRVAPGFRPAELAPSVEAVAEVRALQAAVRAAIDELPPEQQAAVRWHYLDGLPLGEIALLAGAPLGTIKARLHRARERLRTRLLGQAGAPARQEAPMIEMLIDDVLLRVPQAGPGGAPDVVYLFSGRREGPPTPAEPAAPFNLPVPPPAGPDVLEAAGRQAPPPGAEPVRAPLPPPGPGHFVVVLKERAGSRALPIWIGPHEAQLIKWQLAGGSAPRPLTYELMARLLEAAEAQVEQVTISRLHEQVFYATLSVRTPAGRREVDARPSDALALAQRVKAPIAVDEAVLAEAGVAAEALPAHLEARTREWAAGVETPPQAANVEWRWVSAPPPDFSPPRPPEPK